MHANPTRAWRSERDHRREDEPEHGRERHQRVKVCSCSTPFAPRHTQRIVPAAGSRSRSVVFDVPVDQSNCGPRAASTSRLPWRR
jgi:hypothetical protein